MQGFLELIRLHVAWRADDELGGQQARLAARLAEIDARLESSRQGVVAAEAALKHLQTVRRSAETDVQQAEALRDKYKKQLMEAKTNEVYKTLLHEIETAGQTISDRETRVLEAMEGLDGAEQVLQEAKRQLAAATAESGSTRKAVEADVAALDEQREQRRTEARALEVTVPRDLLAQFERLRAGRGGRGLSLVVDHSCTECRVAVRPQVVIELMTDPGRHRCVGCDRLLYRDDMVAGGAPANGGTA